MTWLKTYGDTEGPLGFPMKDVDAKALDDLLQRHPEADYQRVIVEKATAGVAEGERADVSWIQTEAIDRRGEIVLQSGFRDDQFKANPVVTINHDYSRAPIGTSPWRVKLREGDRRGIKAKTVYPVRPAEWPADEAWLSDAAWALVKSGLMGGKSIGFLTLKAHQPTEEEIKKRPELVKVRRIVDEWMLVEYSCCWLPVNPEAVVETTAKALTQLGIDLPPPKPAPPTGCPAIAFTPLGEIEKAVCNRLAALDLPGLAKKSLEESYAKLQGRI